jgi:SAM-dependent methyltransferase
MKGLTVRKMDGHALDFVSQFDAVFSNAALHWMRKPKLVIAGVYRALRSRGRFVAELGGHGNVAAIATAMRAVSRARNGDPSLLAPWFFPTVDEYSRHLTEAGFSVKEIALVPRPTPLKTGMDGWLRTFGRSFFDQFPEPRGRRSGRGAMAVALRFQGRLDRRPCQAALFRRTRHLTSSRHTNAQFMDDAFDARAGPGNAGAGFPKISRSRGCRGRSWGASS